MFGKNKRQLENVTFVQPLNGEAYFYTPIAFTTTLQNSKEKEGKQVFADSDLALAGKLKLIFEREMMTWFEIREENSTGPSKDGRLFALYYFPHRLVASRLSPFDEKAPLQEISKLFDFFVTKAQTRLAKVEETFSPSAYGFEATPLVAKEPQMELEVTTIVTEEPQKELTVTPIARTNKSKKSRE
jgi:hypothetical protein